MDFIEKIIDRVKKNEKKKIVLPETDDIRTLEAAAIAIRENIADIYLIGKEEDILSLAKKNNISLDGCKIIEPVKFADFDLCVNTYYELRKKKGMTLDKASEILTNDYPYFGAMLVKLNYADGMVSGAVHSSSDTLRVALQIIKTAPNTKTASSFFLMDTPQKQYGSNGVFIYSDCGLNQNPTSEQLVDIAKSSAESFELLVEEEPKVAAVGAGLDIGKPEGNMVVDIGGGTTDIAVLSLGNIVTSASIKTAGNTFDQNIIDYIKEKYKLLIGEKTAENIKITIGTVTKDKSKEKMKVNGQFHH